MVNGNLGVDLIQNDGLAGLPVPGEMWVWKCNQQEGEVDPTMDLADLVQTAANAAIAIPSLVSVDRIIDLGAVDWGDEETDDAARSMVISTDDPANPGALWVVLQNIWVAGNPLSIPEGDPYDSAVHGPLYVDALSVLAGYYGET